MTETTSLVFEEEKTGMWHIARADVQHITVSVQTIKDPSPIHRSYWPEHIIGHAGPGKPNRSQKSNHAMAPRESCKAKTNLKDDVSPGTENSGSPSHQARPTIRQLETARGNR